MWEQWRNFTFEYFDWCVVEIHCNVTPRCKWTDVHKFCARKCIYPRTRSTLSTVKTKHSLLFVLWTFVKTSDHWGSLPRIACRARKARRQSGSICPIFLKFQLTLGSTAMLLNDAITTTRKQSKSCYLCTLKEDAKECCRKEKWHLVPSLVSRYRGVLSLFLGTCRKAGPFF